MAQCQRRSKLDDGHGPRGVCGERGTRLCASRSPRGGNQMEGPVEGSDKHTGHRKHPTKGESVPGFPLSTPATLSTVRLRTSDLSVMSVVVLLAFSPRFMRNLPLGAVRPSQKLAPVVMSLTVAAPALGAAVAASHLCTKVCRERKDVRSCEVQDRQTVLLLRTSRVAPPHSARDPLHPHYLSIYQGAAHRQVCPREECGPALP